MRRAATVAAFGLGMTGLLCSPASAGFSASTVGGSLLVRTGSLLGPASLTAAATCSGLGTAKVVLTWPVTTSAFATGYVVARHLTGSSPYVTVATLPGASSATYTDPGLTTGATYEYVVRSTFRQWTGVSPVAGVATPVLCVV